jgi:glyoxylase-like metal-dependent hydrolase (beta-lactamase superfamily II)
MTEKAFRFRVGELNCISLNDGGHDYKIESFFANVDRHDLERALRARNWPTDRIPSPYSSLYIHTGEHQLLVDTGAGDYFATTGKLTANLRQTGIDPAEIDKVIITHAHPDHIGGLVNANGTPTYANARIYTSKREWDFWLAEDVLEKRPFPISTIDLAHRVYDALGDRFSYVQPDGELVPGVRPLAAYGHTPGHLAVEVSSCGESVIYISDAIFHPLHIEHPEWLPDPRYMRAPDQFQETARALLKRAITKNALVLGMHFPPFPCLGHVVVRGEGWQWQPIETEDLLRTAWAEYQESAQYD